MGHATHGWGEIVNLGEESVTPGILEMDYKCGLMDERPLLGLLYEMPLQNLAT